MQIELDDGYQFGMGVFETICLKNGQPLFLDWHLERMENSLRTFGISQTVSEKEVQDWLEDRQENIPELHAMKIMISDKNKLFALRTNPYTKEVLQKGFQLDYSSIMRNETSPLVFHKTMNYGDNIVEKRRTHNLAIDEVVFLNSMGQICEGSTTNIFFVKEQKICTPHVSCGLLPGVIRRFVLEHFPVEEMNLYPQDILQMEECFVTNSLMGIMPVTAIGEKQFKIGPMTKKCQEKYIHTITEPAD